TSSVEAALDSPESGARKLSASPFYEFILTEAHKVVKCIDSMECIRLAGVGRRCLAASLGASLGRCLAASSDVPAWPAACTGKRQSLWPLRFAIPVRRCKNRFAVLTFEQAPRLIDRHAPAGTRKRPRS